MRGVGGGATAAEVSDGFARTAGGGGDALGVFRDVGGVLVEFGLHGTRGVIREPSREKAETKTHLKLSHSSVLHRSLILESLDFQLGLVELRLDLVERGSVRVEVEKDRVPSRCDLLVLALDLDELLAD